MARVHMGVADVKRQFADVIGRVVHGGDRIVVERRGRPVVAIVPLSDLVVHGGAMPDAAGRQAEGLEEEVVDAKGVAGRVGESPPAPPEVVRPHPGSILDALGCGGPEAEEFCKIIDEIVEQRSLDLGRPAPEFE